MLGSVGEKAKKLDPFLSDVDNIHYQISCVQCREPLWETKILKRSGSQVVSTQTHKLGKNTTPFSARLEKCPLCHQRFYGRGKAGSQMYLVRCMKSHIQRLI